MINFAQDTALLEWAGRVIGAHYDPSMCGWISKLTPDGNPLAVVIFDRCDEVNCQMHIATDGTKRWASREFISACYRYAFVQLGMRRVTSIISEDNVKSLKLCGSLGHVQEGVLREWFGDKDGIVMGMLKTECKWLERQ